MVVLISWPYVSYFLADESSVTIVDASTGEEEITVQEEDPVDQSDGVGGDVDASAAVTQDSNTFAGTTTGAAFKGSGIDDDAAAAASRDNSAADNVIANIDENRTVKYNIPTSIIGATSSGEISPAATSSVTSSSSNYSLFTYSLSQNSENGWSGQLCPYEII